MAKDSFRPNSGSPGGGKPEGLGPKKISATDALKAANTDAVVAQELVQIIGSHPDLGRLQSSGQGLPSNARTLRRWVEEFIGELRAGNDFRFVTGAPEAKQIRLKIMSDSIAKQLGVTNTMSPEQFSALVGTDATTFFQNVAKRTKITEPDAARVAAMGGETTSAPKTTSATVQELLAAARNAELPKEATPSTPEATAASTKETYGPVDISDLPTERKPDAFGTAPVNQGVTVPAGQERSWYSKPFDFDSVPTANQAFWGQVQGVIKADMSNDQARLALRKLAQQVGELNPELEVEIDNYLAEFKKVAATEGNLSEAELAAFDTDAAAPVQTVPTAPEVPEPSLEETPIRDRNDPLGILEKVQTQTGTAPQPARTKKDLPPVPAPSRPTSQSTKVLGPNDTVAIVGQSTMPNRKLVKEGEQTNKPFLNIIQAGDNGQFSYLPVRGDLHKLRDSFVFRQVDEDGNALGYFEVPTTSEFSKPAAIDEQTFTQKISQATGDPELDVNASTPASSVNDFDGFYRQKRSEMRRQSGSMQEVIGEKPELPRASEEPTLANDVPSDFLGRPFNPNFKQDIIRSILGIPKKLQESNSGLLRLGGSAIEELLETLGSGTVRKAAADQVVPGVKKAALSRGAKIGKYRPVNEIRLEQIMNSINTDVDGSFTDLSAEDLGVIYHAFVTDPDGLYDSLASAASRGEAANAAIIEQFADESLDLNKKMGLVNRLQQMQDTSVTQSEVIRDMLFDSNGEPKTNLDNFATFVDGKLQLGERPNNFETLMAISARDQSNGAALTPTSYGDTINEILENENIDINAELANDNLVSSPQLAATQRAYQEALSGQGLGLYGPLSKSSRSDVKVNLKVQRAQEIAYEIRQLDNQIRSGDFEGEELEQLIQERDGRIGAMADLSNEIRKVAPGISASDTYADIINNEVGSQSPAGGRVEKKPISDPDSGFDDDVPDAGAVRSASGSNPDYGFNSLGEGLLSMMTRLPEDEARTLIAAALSGDPAALKKFKVRTVDDFRDGFFETYIRSELGRMGGDVITPEVEAGAGATARQAGVPFPSTMNLDVAEVLRLVELQRSLRAQLTDEMSMFDIGFGRGAKVRQQGMGFLGSRMLEFGNRRDASIAKIERLKEELVKVNQELEKQPQLAEVRDKIDGALDEIAGGEGLTPQERAALEKRVELGGWKNPYGNEVPQAKPSAVQRIQQLRNYLDIRPEVELPVRGSNDIGNFLENYDKGSLPIQKGMFEKGDLPTTSEVDVQGSRLTFTPEERTVIEQISSGVGEIGLDSQRSLLSAISKQQRWLDMKIKQSLLSDPRTSAFASSIDLDNLPESHVAQGTVEGVDTTGMTREQLQQLVPNPKYRQAITKRSQTPEQAAAVTEVLRPYLDYQTQLFNLEQEAIKANVRSGIGDGGEAGSRVNYRTRDDFKSVPYATGLRRFLTDPRSQAAVGQIRPLDIGREGIEKLFARAGSPEEQALQLLTRQRYADPNSFLDEPATASIGDQQKALLMELKKAGMNIDYDFGNMGHLGELEPNDLVIALNNMRNSIVDNTSSTLGSEKADRYYSSNVEANTKAAALVDQAIKQVHGLKDPLGNAQAAIYDLPIFEDGAFMVGDQGYLKVRMPDSGFGSMGRVPMGKAGEQSKVMYIPIGLDESSVGGMTDTRFNAKPTVSGFDVNNGRITVPKADISGANTKATAEATADMSGSPDPDATLGELTIEDRLKRAKESGIEARAAAKRKALSQDKNPSQSQYQAEVAPSDAEAKPDIEEPRPSTQDTEVKRTRLQNLKDEFTPGKMTGRAIMGGAVGFGISELYRRHQEQEAARNNMISMPPLTTEKTPEEELIERLRGQRKLKSMTTQVPVMGSGVR